ncbi:hypothetical protein [Streptomyces sp. ADI93-02]|uniref:hypothetical protein n=1 Tax=Streptomyces sp. ADI93-02 TaxID=1522757 RepID=UPI000F559841|nr:hypothetical protein [Streptomyces sp. ADI93-02]
MMRVIFSGTRGAMAGAALVVLTLVGSSWVAAGQAGGADRGVRKVADSPWDDPCRGPINGWQGKPPVSCPGT